ncbi:MAG: hypothetical protein CMF31_06755 [Kordiimonas sp.]|nr:hypothetical protein [Kordiimonas sp.]
MNNGELFEIIFLAMVAGFIFLQLRRVLGRRTGHENEQSNDELFGKPQTAKTDNVYKMERHSARGHKALKKQIDPESTLYTTVQQVQDLDPDFAASEFLDGAERAYTMILEAFWQGDLETLNTLVSNDVYQMFSGVISERQSRQETVDNELVDIKTAGIVDGHLDGHSVDLTVVFESDMRLVTRDQDNHIIEGDPAEVVAVTDHWTFCRDLTRKDPNWTLIATQGG